MLIKPTPINCWQTYLKPFLQGFEFMHPHLLWNPWGISFKIETISSWKINGIYLIDLLGPKCKKNITSHNTKPLAWTLAQREYQNYFIDMNFNHLCHPATPSQQLHNHVFKKLLVCSGLTSFGKRFVVGNIAPFVKGLCLCEKKLTRAIPQEHETANLVGHRTMLTWIEVFEIEIVW